MRNVERSTCYANCNTSAPEPGTFGWLMGLFEASWLSEREGGGGSCIDYFFSACHGEETKHDLGWNVSVLLLAARPVVWECSIRRHLLVIELKKERHPRQKSYFIPNVNFAIIIEYLLVFPNDMKFANQRILRLLSVPKANPAFAMAVRLYFDITYRKFNHSLRSFNCNNFYFSDQIFLLKRDPSEQKVLAKKRNVHNKPVNIFPFKGNGRKPWLRLQNRKSYKKKVS